MPIPSIDQFKALVRKSGAVAPENLERALTAFTPGVNEKDPTRALVRYLIARKLLTPWQSEQLLRGKSQLCLGPYRLTGRLGAGGMSTVFAAEHITMRRQVAIKVLPKDHTSRPHALDRFMREAQVISQCNHPNVVQAYDVDHVQGIFFIVLERVEGRDLEKMVLVDGPLSADRCADFMRQAAEGLAHVHAMGVVHRDVKPSNFLLDLTGVVKLTDLGVALLTMDESGSRTTKQTTLGTTEYMAPEQAMDSHAVDARADLYSLGCTMYFLLTGAPPFPAHTMAEALLKHLKHAAKPIALFREELGLPEIPDDLAAICDKLMAKKPADRYQTADAVASELISWQARRSMSISETWNATASSDTPTVAWPQRASGSSASESRAKWESDETAETKVKHVADAPATVALPPATDAETTETLRTNGSTLCRDVDSLGVNVGAAASTVCEPSPEVDHEPEPQPHGDAEEPEVPSAAWAAAGPAKSAKSAAPAPAEAAPPVASSGSWAYPLAAVVALALATAGGLWAAGLLPGFSAADDAPGKRTRQQSADSTTRADGDGRAAGPAEPPRYLDGRAPVVHTAFGRVGRALVADGATALVFESQPSFDPEKLTVECWLRVQQPLPAGQTAWLVAKNNDERSRGHYSIVLQGDRLAALVNPTGAGEPLRIASDSAIAPGAWRHAALVDDGTAVKFFVDGRLAGSAPLAEPRQPGDGPLAIGVRPDRGVPPTAGLLIDEVRLFRRALSDEDVKFHAERPDWASSQNRSGGLVAAWTFDPLRLENPSFEFDDRGWNFHNSAKVEKDRKKAHHGEKFVRLPEGENGAELSLNGLTKGVTYTFIAWTRSGSPNAPVYVGAKDFGGRDLNCFVASTEWTAVAIPFTVKNDQGSAKVYVWKPGGSDALFDDATVLIGVPDVGTLNAALKVATGPVVPESELSHTAGLDPALLVDPARKALKILCGKHDAPENVQRDGFSARRDSGDDWSDWPDGAARRHCWTDSEALYFSVEVPANTSGVMRLIFCDGDKKGRRQRISIDGRDAGEVGNFVEPRQMMIAIDPEMTADGRVNVACFRTGTGEAVVSDVEFYAP